MEEQRPADSTAKKNYHALAEKIRREADQFNKNKAQGMLSRVEKQASPQKAAAEEAKEDQRRLEPSPASQFR